MINYPALGILSKLGIFLKEGIQRDICAPTVITALSTMPRVGSNLSACRQMGE